MTQFVLASASPQRKTLLEGLGVSFIVDPSTISEPDHPEADPAKRALELSELKAKDVAKRHPGSVVIGCDTLVVAPNGTLLEKPKNPDEARAMLRLQSGATSVVHSGLTVIIENGEVFTELSSNNVRFRSLNDADVEWWISTNQWKDRSGGFQIDGLGQLMIANMEGDWTSVVGLPVYLLGELMRKAGVQFPG